MSANLVVFVEGESDATFLKQLFCYIDFPETRLKPLGGGISKLEHAKPVIVRNCEETGRNAIIFDADSDASEKRRALLNEISRFLPTRRTSDLCRFAIFSFFRTTAILAALKRF